MFSPGMAKSGTRSTSLPIRIPTADNNPFECSPPPSAAELSDKPF